MTTLALDLLSWAAILGGLFFMLAGTIGVLRMPDLFTRLHAAGITDTTGAGLLIAGMCIQAGSGLLVLRLLLVYGFLFFTSPIAAHALARAGLASGAEPVGPSRRREPEPGPRTS